MAILAYMDLTTAASIAGIVGAVAAVLALVPLVRWRRRRAGEAAPAPTAPTLHLQDVHKVLDDEQVQVADDRGRPQVEDNAAVLRRVLGHSQRPTPLDEWCGELRTVSYNAVEEFRRLVDEIGEGRQPDYGEFQELTKGVLRAALSGHVGTDSRRIVDDTMRAFMEELHQAIALLKRVSARHSLLDGIRSGSDVPIATDELVAHLKRLSETRKEFRDKLVRTTEEYNMHRQGNEAYREY